MGLRADSRLQSMSVGAFRWAQIGTIRCGGCVLMPDLCGVPRERSLTTRPRRQVTTAQCQTEALGADNLIN